MLSVTNLYDLKTMKIKENFKVRDIAGEHLIVSQGRLEVDMTQVISLNETALLLWVGLVGRDFTVEDAADILLSNYSIPKELAFEDAQRWIERLVGCGVIDA